MKAFLALFLLAALPIAAKDELLFYSSVMANSPEVTLDFEETLPVAIDRFLSHCDPHSRDTIKSHITYQWENNTPPKFKLKLSVSKHTPIIVSLVHISELAGQGLRFEENQIRIGSFYLIDAPVTVQLTVTQTLVDVLAEKTDHGHVVQGSEFSDDLLFFLFDSFYKKKVLMDTEVKPGQTFITITGAKSEIDQLNRRLREKAESVVRADVEGR